MTHARGISLRRRTLAAAGGLLCLLALSPGAHPTYAGLGICRSDPLVTLSNGRTITLMTNTAADATHVTGISYLLHLPHGLTISDVQYDQSGVSEIVNSVADQRGNRYLAEAMVSTDTPAPVPVVAAMTEDWNHRTASTSGESGETLTIGLSGQ